MCAIKSVCVACVVVLVVAFVVIGSQIKLLVLFYDGCLWRLRLMAKIKSEHLKSSRTNHEAISYTQPSSVSANEKENEVAIWLMLKVV